MKLDRQACLDAACMLIGSAVGVSISAAVLFYLWARQPIQGKPAQPGEGVK